MIDTIPNWAIKAASKKVLVSMSNKACSFELRGMLDRIAITEGRLVITSNCSKFAIALNKLTVTKDTDRRLECTTDDGTNIVFVQMY